MLSYFLISHSTNQCHSSSSRHFNHLSCLHPRLLYFIPFQSLTTMSWKRQVMLILKTFFAFALICLSFMALPNSPFFLHLYRSFSDFTLHSAILLTVLRYTESTNFSSTSAFPFSVQCNFTWFSYTVMLIRIYFILFRSLKNLHITLSSIYIYLLSRTHYVKVIPNTLQPFFFI